MQFVAPIFLVALSALAIPVLIHLFNFRKYKKVYFTNVRFLQEIQMETKKQSRLRQWLILLARLLAVASLVFAFARPYIPASNQEKKITSQRAVSIYLDNSFSMEAIATDGRLLDVAKVKALDIASAYTRSDVFQLVTNDFEGRHHRFVSQDDFRKLVEEVQLSPISRSMVEVIERQNDLGGELQQMNMDTYLISDFQKQTSSLLSAKPDSTFSWFLVPQIAEKKDNLYIDTIYFLSPVHQPGQTVTLRIRIHNASGQSLEKIPVKLTINAVQKSLSSFSVEPNSTTDVNLTFTENEGGIQFGLVEIVDYPVIYDDKFYFTYSILPSIPVLCINEKDPNSYLDALFGHDSTIRFTNSPVKQLDYGNLFANNLLIINSVNEIASGLAQELNRYIRNGGHLVVFPPVNGKTDSYNSLLSLFNLPGYSGIDTVKQRIAWVNTESIIYSDVFEKNAGGKVVLPDNIDLPMVMKHYLMRQEIRSGEEVLLKLQNNQPFFASVSVDKGRIYLFTAPADDSWTLFPKHVLFVPTLFKLSLLSNPIHPLYYVAGISASVDIPADSLSETNLYKLKKQGSAFEVIPEIRKFGSNISLITHDQIRDAGFYEVSRGDKTANGIAFNYNRRESDLKCFTVAELEQQINRLSLRDIHILKGRNTSLSADIREIRQGTPLWKWFVMLTLVFIACEIALVRFLK